MGLLEESLEEYLKYLAREDVQHLWEWDLLENVRAIAGVSTVPKKDQVHQRKLIMQVASNYMFEDVTNRAHLGMGGGSSLSRCFVEGNHMQVAACDEDSAFTYVRIPQMDDLLAGRATGQSCISLAAAGSGLAE